MLAGVIIDEPSRKKRRRQKLLNKSFDMPADIQLDNNVEHSRTGVQFTGLEKGKVKKKKKVMRREREEHISKWLECQGYCMQTIYSITLNPFN